MANRRQSLTVLIVYFIIYALPTLLAQGFHQLGSWIFLIQTLDYLLGAIILGWLAWRTKTPNAVEQHPKNWVSTVLWGIIGVVLVLVGQVVILRLTQLLGQSTASANTNTLLTIGQKYPFFLLAVLVGAPIMEEIVFRKVIFGNLTTVTGTVGAAVISSLLFSFAHADGHLILYAFIGLLFCWLYRHTGRIQTSMIAHILMNVVAVLPLFLT
ncbi:CPBP family intramembrane metalloprotease [Lactobacillus sp. CBA3606]|uniref:CPBP family intramembrane glutamic endopeptidase n=1 Tax=Lactobacillus sp. CBA3606 TaxID=2099789 RepID=UPI000CFB67AE|nr:type II CAAX endopeptidase family protein [Lactobacillus sp. CBA3606]AVK64499.1 CPBP family intramembrane metalloprotease [Lactobacillus sp. CBA3606]